MFSHDVDRRSVYGQAQATAVLFIVRVNWIVRFRDPCVVSPEGLNVEMRRYQQWRGEKTHLRKRADLGLCIVCGHESSASWRRHCGTLGVCDNQRHQLWHRCRP